MDTRERQNQRYSEAAAGFGADLERFAGGYEREPARRPEPQQVLAGEYQRGGLALRTRPVEGGA